MKKAVLITIIQFFFILPLFGQSELDYLLLNKIVEQEKKYLTEDSIYFLTNPNLNSRAFGSGQRKPIELIEWYLSGITRLLKDSLPQYSDRITKRDVKKSFAKWESQKIKYNLKTKKENDKFIYLTKPILVNESLFIIIHVDYSGISVKMFSFVNNEIIELKSNTIRRVGIKFR